jgi:hypothetical protein
MTFPLLEALAADGFKAVRPEELGDLAAACREYCENTGDGRYCILADVLSAMDDWWSEHNESGGVPQYIVHDLEGVLGSHLLPVLRSDNLAEAAMLATMLRREIEPKLTGPSGWKI